jgi:hypothetical protein
MVEQLHGNRARRIIAGLLIALTVVTAVWVLFARPHRAQCVGLCQCWYCVHRVGGQCVQSVGCVGACNSCGNCGGAPGLGGCGADLLGCRGSDCCGAPPPPRPRPTPTPRPPADCHGSWKVIRPPQASVTTAPPNPVAYNQDPSGRGLDVVVHAAGGYAELWWKHPVKSGGRHWHWVCKVDRLRHYDDPIVAIDLTMRRSAQSSQWIQGELSRRYYNTEFLEKLPWQMPIWRGVSMRVTAGLYRYQAEDPGWHEGRAIVRSRGTPLSRPYTLRLPYRVRVWLLDEIESR